MMDKGIRDTFSGYHPINNLIFFILVIVFSMCLMNPIVQAAGLFSAGAYYVYLKGPREARGALKFCIPIILIAMITNPLFNHQGVTILWYFPNGNPLTLESIWYGVGSACMMLSVILWFLCFNEVMTSDKLVYLFGKAAPALSLVISMTLRFIPKFRSQFRVVSESQKSLGRDIHSGKLLQRLRIAISIVSVMITWSLENAIETADSMKSRGYGLPNRTAFAIYRFDRRDRKMLVWLLAAGTACVAAWIGGCYYWSYVPVITGAELSFSSVCSMLLLLALCLTPLITGKYEDRVWRRLMKEITEEQSEEESNDTDTD